MIWTIKISVCELLMFDIQIGSVVCDQYKQHIEYDQESYHLPFSFDCQSESEVDIM